MVTEGGFTEHEALHFSEVMVARGEVRGISATHLFGAFAMVVAGLDGEIAKRALVALDAQLVHGVGRGKEG